MSLLVTGSVAFDNLETPAGKRDNLLGGTAVYFSVAASLFTPVRLVAVVGEDFPDAALADAVGGRPVDTSGLEKRKGSQTFRWTGRYEGSMNEAITLDTQLGVLGERGPVVPQLFRDASHVFLANSHPLLQIELLDSLSGPGLIISDTMNLWISQFKPDLLRLLARVHGLVLNDGEARMLAQTSNLVTAGQAILAMGPRFAIIKKGEHGCLIFADGQVAALPAIPTGTLVDPTGAGDSFAGGLCGYLAQNNITSPTIAQLKRAAAFGTAVASFTIQDFSVAALKAATREQVQQRVDQLQSMLSF